MLYCRSFAGLADFTNRVSYVKASSADRWKRKAHPYIENTALHKRSRELTPKSSVLSTHSNIKRFTCKLQNNCVLQYVVDDILQSLKLVESVDNIANNRKSQIVKKAIDL
jgi:hypothetical protein